MRSSGMGAARWASAVAGVAVVLVLYAPLLVVTAFSFNTDARGVVWTGFSARWYVEVWENGVLVAAVKNTCLVATMTAAGSLITGVSLGWLGANLAQTRARWLAIVLFLPILTPDFVLALGQSLLYRAFGVPAGIGTIVLSQMTYGSAYVGLFVLARLRALRFQALAVAAASLGASPGRVAIDIFAPLVLPAGCAATAIVGVFSASDFLYAFFCGGPGSGTLSVAMYSSVKFGMKPGINVLYVVFLVLALVAVWTADRLEGRPE